jgi:tripartite-type tricarboxylate transporter receptor subunit TctC
VLPVSDVAELHKAGRARVIATVGLRRSSFLPDVATFREAGLDVIGQGWFGLYAPARTPPETVTRLAKVLSEELMQPEIQGRIRQLGLEPLAAGPAELRAIQAADLERWGPVVRASGFRPEQ